jgi:hypothetical protein
MNTFFKLLRNRSSFIGEQYGAKKCRWHFNSGHRGNNFLPARAERFYFEEVQVCRIAAFKETIRTFLKVLAVHSLRVDLIDALNASAAY